MMLRDVARPSLRWLSREGDHYVVLAHVATGDLATAALQNDLLDDVALLKTSVDDNGHLIYPTIQVKNATYTALVTDDVIICSGTFTLTLPPLASTTGHPLIIKNVGTGTITIDGDGSDPIDGAATFVNNVQYLTCTLFPRSTTWDII